MSVIAISAEAYSSAEDVVAQLAERLGYSIVGPEIAAEVARKHDVPVEKVERALAGSRSFLDALTHEWERSLVIIRAVLAELLAKGDQIVLGPATQLIPQHITHVLRVEIVAEPDYRLERAKEQDGVDAGEAAERIAQADEEVAEWTRLVLPRVTWDPLFFDIKISIPSTPVAGAVDVVAEAIGRDTLLPTEASKQAVADFRLAASIGAALMERGGLLCDVRAESGAVTVVARGGGPSKGKIARTVQSLRFESVEDKVIEICDGVEGVKSVEVRPAASDERRAEVRGALARADEATAERSEDVAVPESPIRVMLVDDDTELVEHLGKRLSARGLTVMGVHSGEEAVATAGRQSLDVAIVDLNMPGADGVETLRRLKSIQPMLQVIILTGHGSLDAAFETGQLDAASFRQKPHKLDDLLDDIKAAAARKALSQKAAYERELDDLISMGRSSRDLLAATEHLREKYEQ